MSRIVCPCSRVVERIDDGKDSEFVGECHECNQTGRYDRSSAWKELQPIDQSTLDKLREKYGGADAGSTDEALRGVSNKRTTDKNVRRRK